MFTILLLLNVYSNPIKFLSPYSPLHLLSFKYFVAFDVYMILDNWEMDFVGVVE